VADLQGWPTSQTVLCLHTHYVIFIVNQQFIQVHLSIHKVITIGFYFFLFASLINMACKSLSIRVRYQNWMFCLHFEKCNFSSPECVTPVSLIMKWIGLRHWHNRTTYKVPFVLNNRQLSLEKILYLLAGEKSALIQIN